MRHETHLHDNPFRLIRAGTKTIEMRLYDEKCQKIQVGDEIKFINRVTLEKQLTKVVATNIYNNFSEIYRDYDKVSLGYDKDEKASSSDMEKYYSKEEQKSMGLLE